MVLAESLEKRGGVQPVIEHTIAAGEGCSASAGGVVETVAVDEPVSLTVTAATSPQIGNFVRVEWDFDSDGVYGESLELDAADSDISRCTTHSYSEPGTYFAVVRVTTQSDGYLGSPYGLVQNLARVRVMVE